MNLLGLKDGSQQEIKFLHIKIIHQFLPKNYYVTTGTCTPAIPLKKGDNICADFGKLGQVKFTYI